MNDPTRPWVDTHCHLTDEGIAGGCDEALAAARAAGVGRMITIGTALDTSHAALALAAREPDVWATVGLHPHDAKDGWDWIPGLLGAPRVVAVGECGLDYHYDLSDREVQREAFARQIAWAHEHRLPLVVHSRDAWDDTFAVLDEQGTPPRTVFHCFTGGPTEARRCLERVAWLSFSGILTFKNADEVRAAARACPEDRLLVETDAPYLAPVPHRGRPNHPALVTRVGETLAELRATSAAHVAEATARNAEQVFPGIAMGGGAC